MSDSRSRLLEAALAPPRRVWGLGARSLKLIRRDGFAAFARKARGKVAQRRLRGNRRQMIVPRLEKIFGPLTFPKFANPRVAIIIPVYNNAIRTYNTLRWLLQNTTGVEYLVIVADDASTDATSRMLADVANITVVRGEENTGFVGNCNRALAAAGDTEYVVYLNNDVCVLPGWLEHMVTLMDGDPTAGLVGAKFIYPGGFLQEAGSIVWKDATTWAYGRNDDPDSAQYNYVREVDYCSAAALLVRGSLLREIGGFDERFAPAYFEDTDLAFEARKRGYRTLYQPLAEVIHWEGSSSHGQFSERMQERNRPLFREKWRDVLESEHLPRNTDPRLARDRRRGRQVMLVDYHVPTYDQGGGELRIFELLKLLHGLGYSVSLFPGDPRPSEPYTTNIQQAGIEVLHGGVTLESIGSSLETVIISRPDVASHYIPLFRRVAPQATLVYDTVDLHWVREARRAEVEDSDAVRRIAAELRETELACTGASDATIVVSPVEKEILQREIPGAEVYVIPNVHPVVGCRRPFAEREGLLFVGFYPHLPNRDAMLYFIREIFPLVRERLPGVKLYAVGAEPGPELEALASEDVVVAGWAPDIEPYLDGCRVFVSPLRYGAGIKGKIGHSFSYGLPVVTTTMGAEGMGLVDGDTALITDDPQAFADAVVRLYTDDALWSRLSASGLAFLEHTYSPAVVREKLREMIETVSQWQDAQCNVCAARARFDSNGGHPKEGFACLSCGAIGRDRMLVRALGMCIGRSGTLNTWAPDERLVVVETSGFREHPARLASLFRYLNLVYDQTPPAAGLRGDLQRLPLADDSVDVLISAEVFEHVRDDTRGFQEVLRALRPGGYFILQAPAIGEGPTSTTLVEVRGDEDVYVRPPEYHAGNSLVYRYYGDDLVPRLCSLGFEVLHHREAVPANAIREQSIIIAQKSDRLTLANPPQ